MSSGPITLAKAALRTLLADSTALREWFGASDHDQAGALERIYSRGLPPPADGRRYTLDEWANLRPLAIVSLPDRDPYTSRKAAVGTWPDQGRLEIYFEAPISGEDADDPGAAEAVLTDLVGSIVADMQALAGTAGYIELVEISLAVRPMRCTEQERPVEGDHFWCVLSVAWDGGLGAV